jgi:hypothetical protein
MERHCASLEFHEFIFGIETDLKVEIEQDCEYFINTELAIYALEQVHCWGTYFRARTGQFENFTHLNF